MPVEQRAAHALVIMVAVAKSRWSRQLPAGRWDCSIKADATEPLAFMTDRLPIDRRTVLAGGLVLMAAPVSAQTPSRGEPQPAPPVTPARLDDVDIAIIGAGAAGIGAAREAMRLGKSVVLLESRGRAGGRLFTNTTLPGRFFDGGAAYIHFAETNPWSVVAAEQGVDTYGGQRLWSGSVAFRDGVPLTADEQAARWQAIRAVPDAYDEVDPRADKSMAQAVREQPEAVQAAARIQAQMAAGEDPEHVSVTDWQRLEGGGNRMVPGGYGTLAIKAAAGLPLRTGVTVTAIDWRGPQVSITTDQGTLRARKVIVTVPIGVLKAGRIRFTPALPVEHARALDGLRMGALSKIALAFDKERFGFNPHQFLAEVGDPRRAMTFEAFPQNQDVVLATFGGDYARGLARAGEAAAVDHALERFLKIVGADGRKAFAGGRLVGWSEDPHALGSYAVALPGRARSRDLLARPIDDKIWIAGEATAGVYSMTAGGAYLAGRDAAKAAAARLSTGSIR
jgi:monoamine oxidase